MLRNENLNGWGNTEQVNALRYRQLGRVGEGWGKGEGNRSGWGG